MNNDETRVSPPPPLDITTGDTAPAAAPQNGETLPQTPDDVARAHAFVAPPVRSVSVPGYSIIGELGRGGMGVVYKAMQVKLNRVVALKMILAGGHANSSDLARFVAEAEAVAAIRHPNVIQVFDSGEDDSHHPYMAMEFLEGGSLVQKLRETGQVPPRIAAELMLKIARGVQAAHDRGIVHRDLKPHNVMLDLPPSGAPAGTWGEPKVMDFGLAKRDGAELTQTGAVMGTPAYMAPEQARGETKAIGRAADVYALGVMLYECLSGSVPFRGTDAWSVIRQVMSHEPEPVSRRFGGVPRELDLICRKCLEKSPTERYASAGALADDLLRYLNGEALVGARTGVWYVARRSVRRYWRPVAACLALVLIILAAWVLPSPLTWFTPPQLEPVRVIERPAPAQNDAYVALRRSQVEGEVAVMRLERPELDRAPVHRREWKEALEDPDQSAFKVFEDHRIVDLRRWQQLAPTDQPTDSAVVYSTRRQMVKIAPTTELRIQTRTTGHDVINRAKSPNVKASEQVTDRPASVGGQPMKVRHLVLDVAGLPVNERFELKYTSTFLGSLQTPAEQWFGVIGYEGSVLTTMLMLFPEGKSFREYKLMYAPTRTDPSKPSDPQPYTGPLVTFAAADKSWLYWEIPTPKAHTVYRVDWTW